MATHHYNLSEQFEFTGKAKTLSIIGIVIGIAHSLTCYLWHITLRVYACLGLSF
jgi:hypothetical protein